MPDTASIETDQRQKCTPRLALRVMSSMPLIFHRDVLDHDTGGHPEGASRLATFSDLPDAKLPDGSAYLPYAHTTAYIDQVARAVDRGHWLDPETPVSKGSFRAATTAVAATIRAAEEGGFALVRPPGHHAYPSHASGFCIFNNVGIAASWLASQGQRVLILDFDGHLGDGTAHLFEASRQVAYWSFHQYPAFPGHGWIDEIGVAGGQGYNWMVPLPPGSGDDLFWRAWSDYLSLAEQFNPDVVAISAGFDAYRLDPLLDLRWSLDLFYRLGQEIARCFPRCFATLEGGYHQPSLDQCLFNFLAGVNGHPAPYEEPPTESGRMLWEQVEADYHTALHLLSPYWTIH